MVVKFSMRTSDFRFETQDGYDVIISLHDKMARMAIPGHPQLPTWDNYPVQEEIPHEEDEGLVSLKLYDVSGRCVQTVFSEQKAAGYYDLSLPVNFLSSGTYFLRLETTNKTKTEKVILR